MTIPGSITSAARILTAALASWVAVACSPEERTTDPSPAEVPFQAGNLIGATSGRVGAAQTSSGTLVTLTGLAGNFTRLSYRTAVSGPTTEQAYFYAWDTTSSDYHIWRINIDGSGLTRLTTADSGQTAPSVSPSGHRVVYWQRGEVGGHAEVTNLEELHPDGSSTQLLAEFNGLTVPAWTPDEQWVLYGKNIGGFGGSGDLVRFNLNTGERQVLLSAELDTYRDITIAPVGGVPTAIFDRNDSFWRMDLNTFDTTFYLASPDAIRGISHPRLSPDGTRILYWHGLELHLGEVDHPDQAPTIYTATSIDDFPRVEANWMRDGSGLVALLPEDTTSFSQLWTMSLGGQRLTQFTNFPNGVENQFSVGPASSGETSRVLIGEDGELGSSASGIIFGQGTGGAVTAVVAFGSGRPRSVALSAETGINSTAPVLTYMLTADQLKTLRFVNGPAGGTVVSVIDSSSALASGAIITFSASTGEVVLILPFSTANSLPAISDEGGVRIFRGAFIGVWRGGKNLAPSGASAVSLDTGTGALQVH